MNGLNTVDGLATITKKISILYARFCFVLLMLFILIANTTALEQKPGTIESVVFSLFVNCSFDKTFLF